MSRVGRDGAEIEPSWTGRPDRGSNISRAQVIKDYVAFTNESLRAAVKEYFEDKAAAERRHGKMGTWDVSRVTDMSKLFATDAWSDDPRREFNDPGIGAWDTSSALDMGRTQCGSRNIALERVQ